MTSNALPDFLPTTAQQLTVYRFPTLSAHPQLNHAIFTRNGGVSQPPFRSLNLSHSVGDDPIAIERNFQAVCNAAGISPGQVVACHLVHGNDVLTVTKHNRRPVMGYADGLVTAEPDIFLYLRFADCTPLLYFDPVQQVIGLTHAGWRGTLKNAAAATVAAMQQLGSHPANIIAAIGPSIGPCCYEVGVEVMSAAAESLADTDGLFKQNGKPGHAHFDMWAANRRQLAAAGVGQIIDSGLCTACRTDQFFSHRAEKGKTGRFGVLLGLTGDTA